MNSPNLSLRGVIVLPALILLAGCSDNSTLQAPAKIQSFHRAVQEGRRDIVAKLLSNASVDPNDIAPNGVSPLIVASGMGHYEIVDLLIQHGAKVNLRHGKLGFTALMAAAEQGEGDIVTLLLQKGADVNAPGNDGQTPLIVAAYKGHRSIVETLLSHRANVNAVTSSGATALMGASQEGHVAIVKSLLQAGADVNAQSRDGWTALKLAEVRHKSDVVSLLQRSGHSPKSSAGSDTIEDEATSSKLDDQVARIKSGMSIGDVLHTLGTPYKAKEHPMGTYIPHSREAILANYPWAVAAHDHR